ncbi:MAG TPA: 3-oxoacyl-ACP synthase [Oligoflexia bacterium]|nr:3-oxoacyl-ACP synthase [Oligoflexia bacterium]HMR23944.1 3-oxoacyl-ACP synthase [Oligoflexia bacterium]
MYQWLYVIRSLGSEVMSVSSAKIMRQLAQVWIDFSSQLDQISIVKKINQGKLRIEDYKSLLLNHRQQVIDGGRWIARAASGIDAQFSDLREKFIQHCYTEHQDYKMLEQNYVSVGGDLKTIQNYEKNIGSEALSSFMFHKASQSNPFDLLGSMFIIEGLGKNKAGDWGKKIKSQLNLEDTQVSFYLYHAEHDQDHLKEFDEILSNPNILAIPDIDKKMIKTAKVTSRLYCLQLEELDNI